MYNIMEKLLQKSLVKPLVRCHIALLSQAQKIVSYVTTSTKVSTLFFAGILAHQEETFSFV